MGRCPVGLSLVLSLGAVLPAQRDNVLILVADDLGVDSMAVYGEGTNPPPTPNLDALAARGVMFRNAWANPLCSPSRALIHTGRYALRTGIGSVVQWYGPRSLSREETTLPELLDAAQSGYAHAAIGKWHLTNFVKGGFVGPNVAGWSHFAGQVSNPSDYYSWPRTVNGVTGWSTRYMTTQNVDDALEWIGSAQEPWTCYLAFFAPHRPLHAPPATLHSQHLAGKNPQTEPVPFFHAMVEAMDNEIGRLFTSLGTEVMARTNVIFLGDNGTDWPVTQPPFVPQHAKGTVYEGGVNVPLIVAGPAVGSPGREEPALVSVVDLYPTIAELCGVAEMPPHVKIDGVSLVPHLAAPNQAPVRSAVYAELFYVGGGGQATVRNATHKLIRRFEVTPPRDELYDLVNDVFEQNDLMAAPLSPEDEVAYRALNAELDAIRSTSGTIVGYGAAECVGSNGRPVIGWAGVPTIGGSYRVWVTGAAVQQPALLLMGPSNTVANGIALPFSLESLGGGPGCLLYASPGASIATPTNGAGVAAVTVQVPNLHTLIAGTYYHTWVISDPLAPGNALGLTTSDAAAATIGSPP